MRNQPKYASNTDQNQKEIVDFLRWQGWSVKVTSTIGQGFPDLVVGKDGYNYLVEIKSKTGKLTPDQAKFFSEWRGATTVLRSIDDAVRFNQLHNEAAQLNIKAEAV